MGLKRDDEGKGGIFGQTLPGTGGDLRRGEDDPETARRDGDDTEGHLFTGGPTTQGEFAKRAPNQNPHGER